MRYGNMTRKCWISSCLLLPKQRNSSQDCSLAVSTITTREGGHFLCLTYSEIIFLFDRLFCYLTIVGCRCEYLQKSGELLCITSCRKRKRATCQSKCFFLSLNSKKILKLFVIIKFFIKPAFSAIQIHRSVPSYFLCPEICVCVWNVYYWSTQQTAHTSRRR